MAALYQRNYDHRFFSPPCRRGNFVFRKRYIHSGFGEQLESTKFTFPQAGTRRDNRDIFDNIAREASCSRDLWATKKNHKKPIPYTADSAENLASGTSSKLLAQGTMITEKKNTTIC